MKNKKYLYIWNSSKKHSVVISGVTVKDMLPSLKMSGLILLSHDECDKVIRDDTSGLDYIQRKQICSLAKENIYRWGDVAWIDFSSKKIPCISKEDLAAVLYFKHCHVPLRKAQLPSIGNKFMVYGHDDGWYLEMHYSQWQDVVGFFDNINLPSDKVIKKVIRKGGDFSVWADESGVSPELYDVDIDSILNRRMK